MADGKSAEALRSRNLPRPAHYWDLLSLRQEFKRRIKATLSRTGIILRRVGRKDVAGLEYFWDASGRRCLSSTPGFRVKAHPLTAPDGQPLDSRSLVADVHGFLDDVGFQSRKMRDRLTSDQGFDHAWQDMLHKFYRELMPKGVLEELRGARTVIVVPHHILHYFPFAALVTQPDRKPRGKAEMVQPRFLVDEPFSLCRLTSLVSWLAARTAAQSADRAGGGNGHRRLSRCPGIGRRESRSGKCPR